MDTDYRGEPRVQRTISFPQSVFTKFKMFQAINGIRTNGEAITRLVTLAERGGFLEQPTDADGTEIDLSTANKRRMWASLSRALQL